jgi:hypothetical protein
MVIHVGVGVYPGKQAAAIAALKTNHIKFEGRKGD